MRGLTVFISDSLSPLFLSLFVCVCVLCVCVCVVCICIHTAYVVRLGVQAGLNAGDCGTLGHVPEELALLGEYFHHCRYA